MENRKRKPNLSWFRLSLIFDPMDPTSLVVPLLEVRLSKSGYRINNLDEKSTSSLTRQDDPGGSRSLVELLPLDDTRLLALEREYVRDIPRNTSRPVALYEIDTSNATDINSSNSLIDGGNMKDVVPVSKKLVFDFRSLVERGIIDRVGSLEAMAYGPLLHDGRKTIIFVEDNDNDVDTQVIVLALDMEPSSSSSAKSLSVIPCFIFILLLVEYWGNAFP